MSNEFEAVRVVVAIAVAVQVLLADASRALQSGVIRILVVGAGGVGAAFASIAARRPIFSDIVLADIDLNRASHRGGAGHEREGARDPSRRSRVLRHR